MIFEESCAKPCVGSLAVGKLLCVTTLDQLCSVSPSTQTQRQPGNKEWKRKQKIHVVSYVNREDSFFVLVIVRLFISVYFAPQLDAVQRICRLSLFASCTTTTAGSSTLNASCEVDEESACIRRHRNSNHVKTFKTYLNEVSGKRRQNSNIG